MPTQNISITQGETKNFEFNHDAATTSDKVWFTIYNGRDPVIYKESANYGGSSDEIEIVTSGQKKYIVKVKSNESERLWLNNVTYKLYWINPTTEEDELLYSGTVNVSPQQQQQPGPQLLGYKRIQVWDSEPDVEDFEEGDLIYVDELKILKNGNWQDIGGATQGTYYRVLKAIGTPQQNGEELLHTYAEVKALAPSLDLNVNKRFTIYIAAGNYLILSPLQLDVDFVDITSITGEADVIIYGDILISASNVWVTGLNATNISLGNNLKNIVCKNCVANSDYSFNASGDNIVSGTFINCISGNYSFGSDGTASGTFEGCTGGNNSFGGGSGIASGTFKDCTGDNASFGGNGVASGTFIRCKGGTDSFGSDGNITGTIEFCSTEGRFRSLANGGKIIASIQKEGTPVFVDYLNG